MQKGVLASKLASIWGKVTGVITADFLGIMSPTAKVEGEAWAARENTEEAKVNWVLLDLL
jgi:hypothetical protein